MTQQAELINEIDKLPSRYIGEVLDYVGYLRKKAQDEKCCNDKANEPLSKKFAGTLRLSDTAYEALQNSLQEGRDEWNRNIF